jgi:hypothetical protein
MQRLRAISGVKDLLLHGSVAAFEVGAVLNNIKMLCYFLARSGFEHMYLGRNEELVSNSTSVSPFTDEFLRRFVLAVISWRLDYD